MKDILTFLDHTLALESKFLPKFPEGSSQHSLLKNRIHALQTARNLVSGEVQPSREEMEFALPRVESMIRKMSKARDKYEPGSKNYNIAMTIPNSFQTIMIFCKTLFCYDSSPSPLSLFCSRNPFLLEHSSEIPELNLRSEQEFRFYSELKRALHHTEINDESAETGFPFNDTLVVFENGKINVYTDKKIIASYSVDDFSRRPGAVFRKLQSQAIASNNS